jgi:hypothetical protein
MPKITHEELLAEIERIDRSGSDGATVTELVEQTGLSRDTILGRLRVTAREGRLAVGRKPITTIHGLPGWVPCYKVLKRRRGK